MFCRYPHLFCAFFTLLMVFWWVDFLNFNLAHLTIISFRVISFRFGLKFLSLPQSCIEYRYSSTNTVSIRFVILYFTWGSTMHMEFCVMSVGYTLHYFPYGWIVDWSSTICWKIGISLELCDILFVICKCLNTPSCVSGAFILFHYSVWPFPCFWIGIAL